MVRVQERHDLAGLVDGSLTSLVPARYAWDAVLIQGRYLLTIHPSFSAEASMLLNR